MGNNFWAWCSCSQWSDYANNCSIISRHNRSLLETSFPLITSCLWILRIFTKLPKLRLFWFEIPWRWLFCSIDKEHRLFSWQLTLLSVWWRSTSLWMDGFFCDGWMDPAILYCPERKLFAEIKITLQRPTVKGFFFSPKPSLTYLSPSTLLHCLCVCIGFWKGTEPLLALVLLITLLISLTQLSFNFYYYHWPMARPYVQLWVIYSGVWEHE